MISVTEAEQRVQRGASYFDAMRPGWERRVHVDTLDINDVFECVVAQASGMTYFNGCDFFGVTREQEVLFGYSCSCRFETTSIDCEAPLLTAAWKQLLNTRASAAA